MEKKSNLDNTSVQPLMHHVKTESDSSGGAAAVPFSALCNLLERVAKAGKAAKKRELLSKFMDRYGHNDYFPVLRLLLPQLDKERQTYGLKETMLGKLYVEILNIAPTSDDAVRLVNWRKPTKSTGRSEAGDFGNAVFQSLQHRCNPKGDCSIADVNAYLDQLNIAQDKVEKGKILKALLRRTTAVEQKWIVRIILKELKIGMSEKTILSFLHPDAVDYFNVTNNLRKVCEDLKDPTSRIAQGTISLFNPIKPMLASRHPPEKVTKLMGGHDFVIETKFDGERVQVHKDGDNIRLYTRNANDCTSIYGPQLIPTIKELVKVRNCILDGELLIWDKLSERFEEFGKLKTYAAEMKNSEDMDYTDNNADKQLCYIVFDLLFLNDKPILDFPLRQRISLLHRCITTKPRTLEIVEQRRATNTQDILNALDQAIENREEGIIVKNLDSQYVPNERKENWIKLKPEYVEGVGDDLDLLILAGYWGSGQRKGGTISHFLVGVKAGNAFYSLARVGSGYSDKELKGLQQMLAPYWVDASIKPVPPTIQLAGVFHKEKPDVWIDPRNSKILQVKAAQITVSEKYKAGYTLRFPRVVKIRSDKNWDQAMTLQELIELAKSFGGRYAKRRVNPNNAEEVKSPKRRRLSPTKQLKYYLDSNSDANDQGITIISDLLANMEFAVLSGDDTMSKRQIEHLILSHRGTVVAYPLDTTHYVIAGRETLKIKNLKESDVIDVVHYRWLLDSIDKGTIVPLEPRYLLHAKPATLAILKDEVDPYGDSYTMDTSVSQLRELFEQITCKLPTTMESQQQVASRHNDIKNEEKSACEKKEEKQLAVNCLTEQEIAEFEYKIFGGRPWWSLFRGKLVYMDKFKEINKPETVIANNNLDVVEHVLRFYGAKITPKIDRFTTHVVFNPADTERIPIINDFISRLKKRFPDSPQCFIVAKDWVLEAVEQHADLDERDFSVSQAQYTMSQR